MGVGAFDARCLIEKRLSECVLRQTQGLVLAGFGFALSPGSETPSHPPATRSEMFRPFRQ